MKIIKSILNDVYLLAPKIFSDDSEPKRDGFYWRKHARLQVFMNNQWIKRSVYFALSHNSFLVHIQNTL